jgi:hypothetical protein
MLQNIHSVQQYEVLMTLVMYVSQKLNTYLRTSMQERLYLSKGKRISEKIEKSLSK